MTEPTSDQVIEAYCVRCKMSVDMLEPEPVWTSRGTPGNRGTCPECGGAVFRMGASHLHEGLTAPQAITITPRGKTPKLPPNTVYINYTAADEEIAQQLAADLEKIGMTVWLHDPTPEKVNWAGGVHPALKDCTRMVVVLSDSALDDSSSHEAWSFFRDKRKPIVVVQLGEANPPDALRRSTRLDFRADYRPAFRQLVQALAR